MLKDFCSDEGFKGIGFDRVMSKRSNRVPKSVNIELEYLEIMSSLGESRSDIVNLALNYFFAYMGYTDPDHLDDPSTEQEGD